MKGKSIVGSPKSQQQINTSIPHVLNTVMRNIAPSETSSYRTTQNSQSNIGAMRHFKQSISQALVGSSSNQFD